jgi:TolA-binding protein
MMLDGELGTASAPSVDKMAGLARDHRGAMSDVQEARALHTVLSRFTLTRGGARRRSARPFLLAGAATALAAAALLVPSLLRKQPLTYSMSGGEVQSGYFQAGPGPTSTLQFSDGTKLDLAAGTRGRIASIDADGARVMLDEGRTHVRVVPRQRARWLFEAGPCVVRVQGTEFTMAWNADDGRLDVRLDHGAVSVTGPLSGEAIGLRPGQWLTVRLAAHEVLLRDFDRAQPPLSSAVPAEPLPTAEPPLAPPVPQPADLPAPTASKSHRATHAQGQQSWAPARTDGDWQRILDNASRRGLERTLTERSSEDLALLADAAHYLHRDDIAEKALRAQRQRFAGSTRAKDAAFLLGRIVEAEAGGASRALAWYDRHLAEAPDGAYASEALGRKMTVLARLRGEEAARPVADEYLRRYPGGTYARAARAYASKP